MKIGIDGLYLKGKRMGVGTQLFHLIENLPAVSKPNEEFWILANSPWRKQPFHHSIIKYQSLRSPKILWKNVSLPMLQRTGRFDLLFLPNYTVPMISSGKTVVTIHDIIPFVHPEWSSVAERMRFHYLVQNSSRKASHVITVSQATKIDLMQRMRIPSNKISVIPPGVSEAFTPAPKTHQKSFRMRYGIIHPFFLTVGAVHPRRNIFRLLEAYKILKTRRSIDTVLILIGMTFSENYLRQVKEWIERLGLTRDILWLDYVSQKDLVCFYSYSEAFVYPSLYEGFGLPVLEAMACGTPVITSNLSSMPEVVGDSAILIDPLDVVDIADAMERMLDNRKMRLELIRKGLKQKNKFTWTRLAGETLEVFRRVVSCR
jgi:glycosyltransferase involved in cell wall biosynthesis